MNGSGWADIQFHSARETGRTARGRREYYNKAYYDEISDIF